MATPNGMQMDRRARLIACPRRMAILNGLKLKIKIPFFEELFDKVSKRQNKKNTFESGEHPD